jgi:hypothetical protein
VIDLGVDHPLRFAPTRDADYAFAAKIDAKYGSNLREMDGPGESRVAVTIRTTRVRAWG